MNEIFFNAFFDELEKISAEAESELSAVPFASSFRGQKINWGNIESSHAARLQSMGAKPKMYRYGPNTWVSTGSRGAGLKGSTRSIARSKAAIAKGILTPDVKFGGK